jgi:putative lipoic acid-binding regulatory protein
MFVSIFPFLLLTANSFRISKYLVPQYSHTRLLSTGFGKTPENLHETTPKVPRDDVPSIDAMRKSLQDREKAFAHLTFPTPFVIKVIGTKDDQFLSDILLMVQNVTKSAPADMAVSTKDKGKYLSITMNPVFESVSQIYAVYEIVGKDPRVQFVL